MPCRAKPVRTALGAVRTIWIEGPARDGGLFFCTESCGAGRGTGRWGT